MSLVLHAFPASPRSFKLLAAANHLGLAYDLRIVDLGSGRQRQPEFLKLNPNGRVPVLEDDGFVLWESNAILQYLAAKAAVQDERGRADVARWLFWDTAQWDPACAIFMYENLVKSMFKMGAPDQAELAKGAAKFTPLAAILNQHLLTRRFVCGDQPTVADFALASPLLYTKEADLPVAPHAEVRLWYDEIARLPAWRKAAELLAAGS